MILLTLTPITAITKGQDYEEIDKRINILPDDSMITGPGDYNNIANESFIEEHTLIESDLGQDKGLYLGPYAQSSLFEFGKNDGHYIEFESKFNFSHSEINSGSSKYFIRIPIVWDANAFRDAYIFINCERPQISETFTLLSPSGSNNIIVGDYGIYILMSMPLLPNQELTMRLVLRLRENHRLKTYLTLENFQTDTNTNIRYFKYDRNDDYIYNYTETLEHIYFAWAFIFMEGIGENGYYGLEVIGDRSTLPWYGYFPIAETIYLYFGHNSYLDGNETNGTHISLYIPFRQKDEVLVDWLIEISITSDSAVGGQTKSRFQNPFDAGDRRDALLFNVTNTDQFLLFSSIFPIVGNTTINTVYIRARPDNNITLLMNLYDSPPSQIYRDDYSSFSIYLNYFYVLEFTSGEWVRITPTKLFHIYVYGWGTGYKFPGDAALYLFINNQTRIFITGNLWDLKNVIDNKDGDPDTDPWYQYMLDIVKSIPGKIYGFLKWIWNGILQIGEFIYGQFIALIDWLISIIGKAKELITNIMYAMPFVLPAIIIIAIVRINTDDDMKLKTSIDKKISRVKEMRKIQPISRKSRIKRLEKVTSKSKEKKRQAEKEIKRLEGDK